jgi:hypothetical protein
LPASETIVHSKSRIGNTIEAPKTSIHGIVLLEMRNPVGKGDQNSSPVYRRKPFRAEVAAAKDARISGLRRS